MVPALQDARWGDGISFLETVFSTEEELRQRVAQVMADDVAGESWYGFAAAYDMRKELRSLVTNFACYWHSAQDPLRKDEHEEAVLEKYTARLRGSFLGPYRSASREHPQDWVQALRFLEWLGLDAWRFEALSPVPLYKERYDPVTGGIFRRRRNFDDDNIQAAPRRKNLVEVNAAVAKMASAVRHGYQTMVQLHPAKNAKASGVTAVKTLFVDLDGVDLAGLPLRPTVIVESSRGRHHAYYRLTTSLDPDDGLALNKALCERLGGDIACLRIAGKGLKVVVPGLPRKRKGRSTSTPIVVNWNGPEYAPEDIRNLCGSPAIAVPARSIPTLAPGEQLSRSEIYTIWLRVQALLTSAKAGHRLARLEDACRLYASYRGHDLCDPIRAGRIVEEARRLWPECDSTIVDTVRRVFKGTYPAAIPQRRHKTQTLDAWAREVFAHGVRVVYTEAVEARPESATDREARNALTRCAKELGWTVKRSRCGTRTSSTASPI